MTERPSLTDEQLRELVLDNRFPAARDCATELLALRAERAKPTPSDEERAERLIKYIDMWWTDDDDSTETPTQRALTAFISIRAEGSAERAKLEAALTQYDRRPDVNSIDAIIRIVRALAQPAESGATVRVRQAQDRTDALVREAIRAHENGDPPTIIAGSKP